MGLLGGRASNDGMPVAPVVRSSRKPPYIWGSMEVEGDSLVVRLEGWRAVWAVKRVLRLPVSSLVGVMHDPAAYQRISTRLRKSRGSRSTLFKLGSQHGQDGWSFWACGWARNAVVVETTGARYRFVIVEVADPPAVVRAVSQAAGLVPAIRPDPPVLGGSGGGK